MKNLICLFGSDWWVKNRKTSKIITVHSKEFTKTYLHRTIILQPLIYMIQIEQSYLTSYLHDLHSTYILQPMNSSDKCINVNLYLINRYSNHLTIIPFQPPHGRKLLKSLWKKYYMVFYAAFNSISVISQ